MPEERTEAFRMLDIERLQGAVQKITKNYRHLHFTRVILFKNIPRLAASLPGYKKTYVIVFEVLDQDRYTQQYEDLKECLRPPYQAKLFSLAGDYFANAYRNPPAPDYNYWEEWDFHLVTVNKQTTSDSYGTASEDFVDNAQNLESITLFSNDVLRNQNDMPLIDKKLAVLINKIDDFSTRIEQHDEIEDLYVLRKLKSKFQYLFHRLLHFNVGLNLDTNYQEQLQYKTEPALDNYITQAVFYDNGNHFIIGYKDNAKTYNKDIGLKYLRYILQNKSKEVKAEDMVNECNPGLKPQGSNTAEKSFASSEVSTILSSSLPNLDDQAVEDYREKIKDIELELEQATDMGDIGKQEKLRDEKEFLEKELLDNYYQKKSGVKDDTQKKMTNSAGRGLKEAMLKIKDCDEALGTHLGKHIRPFARTHKYEPEQDLHWIFE